MEILLKTFGLDCVDTGRGFADLHALNDLSVPIYATDAHGGLSFYNKAAAKLWGRSPAIGHDRWCGAYDIYTKDGEHLPHSECPMAQTIKKQKPMRGVEMIVRRPDGSCFRVLPFPTPMHDHAGNFVGAINMVVYLGEAEVPVRTPLLELQSV